jgi:hypothetical protein
VIEVLFALAVGPLTGPFPDPVVTPIPSVQEDCVKPKQLERAPAKKTPRVLTQHKPKRLFKADPKPKDEEPCEGAIPPAPRVTLIDAPAPISLPPIDVPEGEGPVFPAMLIEPLPDEPEEPVQRFGDIPGPVTFAGPCCALQGHVPPVPEPSTWLLLLAGLGALPRIASSACRCTRGVGPLRESLSESADK